MHRKGSGGDQSDMFADDTSLPTDDTSLPTDDTSLAADDTIISVDDTVILGQDTVIAADEKEADSAAPTQPVRRVGDRPGTAPRETVSFSLRFVTGARFALTSAVVVGRSPRMARLAKTDAVQLVSVPSREGRVSSTHAELRQVGDVVVLTDLRSTNGTRVTLAGGVVHHLAPGDSMALREGAVVDVGDGNRIEVIRDNPRDASKDIAR